jgi:uncharacterized protein YndB with AHSA1/START domain
MAKTSEPRNAVRVGDAAVQAKTGKTWAEWFAVLDKAGAAKLDHKGIVAILDNLGVDGWWCQMVTVGYEQERGLRDRHQKADGYAVSARKTIAVPVERLFAAWHDAKLRKRWLKEAITIRKATAPKSLRITWADGVTNVEVNLYPKGEAKSQITVQHSKLGNAAEAAKMKAFWAGKLERLQELLPGKA